MVKINDLIITQQELRCYDALSIMADYVRKGGIWNKAKLNTFTRISPLIQISCFPDGKLYIHDGHHRITSIFLAGRDHLVPEEYQINSWTYEKYLEINVGAGWVTPFDPRTTCRKPDLDTFKTWARSLPKDRFQEILTRQADYCEPRLFYKVSDFVIKDDLCGSL